MPTPARHPVERRLPRRPIRVHQSVVWCDQPVHRTLCRKSDAGDFPASGVRVSTYPRSRLVIVRQLIDLLIDLLNDLNSGFILRIHGSLMARSAASGGS